MDDSKTTEGVYKYVYTPEKIVEGNIRFNIPLYQRPYAWERQQVEQLLRDLKQARESTPDHNYYLGTLSVARNSLGKLDLIDGQQRLTTLMLIARTLNTKNGWDKFWAVGDRLNLYGREADKAYLRGDDDAECNLLMKATVNIVRNLNIDENLSTFIYEHAAFFLAELPTEYSLSDRNLYFVRMNNRGKQLEQHEILKAKLASILSQDQRRAFNKDWDLFSQLGCGEGEDGKDDHDIWDQGSRTIEQILGEKQNIPISPRSDNELFYDSIVTFPQFLLIALSRFPKTSEQGETRDSYSNPAKLLEAYGFGEKKPAVYPDEKKTIEWTPELVNKFHSVLEKQHVLFTKYFIRRVRTDEGYKFPTLDFWSTADPKLRKRLLMVQSFLHVAREPHQWLPQAFDWLEKNSFNEDNFIQALEKSHDDKESSILKEGHRRPSLPVTIDSMVYGNVDYYWFYRLDYELWKVWVNGEENLEIWQKSLRESAEVKTLIDKFRFRQCNSVEHIYPQQGESASNVSNELKHAFGNLALLARATNSKFSNNPCDGKRKWICDDKKTESLKMLHYLWMEKQDGERIAEHGKLMWNLLKTALGENHEREKC